MIIIIKMSRITVQFLQSEFPLTVTVLWQVPSVEYKDMWEWVCFPVLGVSASVNQST